MVQSISVCSFSSGFVSDFASMCFLSPCLFPSPLLHNARTLHGVTFKTARVQHRHLGHACVYRRARSVLVHSGLHWREDRVLCLVPLRNAMGPFPIVRFLLKEAHPYYVCGYGLLLRPASTRWWPGKVATFIIRRATSIGMLPPSPPGGPSSCSCNIGGDLLHAPCDTGMPSVSVRRAL